MVIEFFKLNFVDDKTELINNETVHDTINEKNTEKANLWLGENGFEKKKKLD